MKYQGYEINTIENGIEIEGIKDFNPVHTFECGQCFRWHKEFDGSYTGVVRGKVANVSYRRCSAYEFPLANVKAAGAAGALTGSAAYGGADTGSACISTEKAAYCGADAGGTFIIRNASIDDFKQVWFDYFDLGRDYSVVKQAVVTDHIMKEAVEYGSGIRLLRQEPWETLISFILSSNNRIPRIMKIIEDMCRYYGKVLEYGGKLYYSFPDAESLAACSLEQIQVCKAGYRCGYIHKTAARIALGEFSLQKLSALDTCEARDYLLQLYGVGNKVADCMLLFSGMKHDVFPTDVWVKRVMEQLYFKREASFKEIQQFAAKKFGEYAGIAQQYLFYYARSTLGN